MRQQTIHDSFLALGFCSKSIIHRKTVERTVNHTVPRFVIFANPVKLFIIPEPIPTPVAATTVKIIHIPSRFSTIEKPLTKVDRSQSAYNHENPIALHKYLNPASKEALY